MRTTAGFALAEARLRGLGELRFGDLLTDGDLLSLARRDAFALVAADAGLRAPEHALLRAAVWQRYGQTLALAEVG